MVKLNRYYLVKKIYGEENLLNVTAMNFERYKITKIDRNTFESLTKLEYISLNGNSSVKLR